MSHSKHKKHLYIKEDQFMQNFVGYKLEVNENTGKIEKKWTECVANDREEAAKRMTVALETVCLAL